MSKKEKIEGIIEITIWALSVMCGIVVFVTTMINGAGVLKAFGLGLLGVIAFMAVALLIYLPIHSRITLGKDGK